MPKALVIGGGPVGSLSALSFHKRGWEVEVWETREDCRKDNVAPANLRSINLALSARGIEAMKSVDRELAETILSNGIPMKGRMIHHVDGHQVSQLYDPSGGQCINSLPRPLLNQKLLQSLPSAVKLRFETKLDRIDWKEKRAFPRAVATSAKPGEEAQDHRAKPQEGGEGVAFDLIVGCDGSWSKVRSEMMRQQRMDFSQSFIQHAYIELHMPPKAGGGFTIDEHHLHIWPRHAFMLIGLPNQDGSFTLTLFAPFKEIEHLTTRQACLDFLNEHFPTAVKWAGAEQLVDDLAKNPRGSLVTINVTPCHFSSSAVLLGDSSHSMVPFYGQGLNCGLEDVRIMNCFLDAHGIDSAYDEKELEDALKAYSAAREKDLEAICELAMDNYTEMRSSVVTPMYHVRRVVDMVLSTVFHPSKRIDLGDPAKPFPTPAVSGWSSLYSMVTFRPDVPYSEALRKEKKQKQLVARGTGLAGVATLAAVGYLAARRWR